MCTLMCSMRWVIARISSSCRRNARTRYVSTVNCHHDKPNEKPQVVLLQWDGQSTTMRAIAWKCRVLWSRKLCSYNVYYMYSIDVFFRLASKFLLSPFFNSSSTRRARSWDSWVRVRIHQQIKIIRNDETLASIFRAHEQNGRTEAPQ